MNGSKAKQIRKAVENMAKNLPMQENGYETKPPMYMVQNGMAFKVQKGVPAMHDAMSPRGLYKSFKEYYKKYGKLL